MASFAVKSVAGVLMLAGVAKVLAVLPDALSRDVSFAALAQDTTTAAAAGSDTNRPPTPAERAAREGIGTIPKKPIAGEAALTSMADACTAPEELFLSLNKERDLLASQKQEIADDRAEIELARESLRVETQRLGELKETVEALLEKAQTAHKADVERLTGLYSAMKPREAAMIMDEMDIEVAVLVLSAMNERNAAPILARMNPVRSRAVSKIMLERAKLPGDQNLVNVKLQ